MKNKKILLVSGLVTLILGVGAFQANAASSTTTVQSLKQIANTKAPKGSSQILVSATINGKPTTIGSIWKNSAGQIVKVVQLRGYTVRVGREVI